MLGHGLDGDVCLDATGQVADPPWLALPRRSTADHASTRGSAPTRPAPGTFEVRGRIDPASSSLDERDCTVELTLHGFPSLEGLEEVRAGQINN